MVIEWKSMLLIVAVLFLALVGIKLLDKKFKLNAELKRKAFHMSMGIVMLALPYICTSVLTVGILAVIAILIMIILKNTKLKNTIGSVLYGVERESFGEIFYTISVFLIFYLSKGNKVLYSIPILILTFADSADGRIHIQRFIDLRGSQPTRTLFSYDGSGFGSIYARTDIWRSRNTGYIWERRRRKEKFVI